MMETGTVPDADRGRVEQEVSVRNRGELGKEAASGKAASGYGVVSVDAAALAVPQYEMPSPTRVCRELCCFDSSKSFFNP